MSCSEIEKVERYLKSVLKSDAIVLALTDLSDPTGELVKGFGYGSPVRVDYQIPDGRRRIAVLHTMSPGPFGHDHMGDRAQILLWSHDVFNRLPSSRAVAGCEWVPDGREYCFTRQRRGVLLLTDYVEGQALVQTEADREFGWAPLGLVNCDGLKQRVPRSTTPTSSPFGRPACPSCIVLS